MTAPGKSRKLRGSGTWRIPGVSSCVLIRRTETAGDDSAAIVKDSPVIYFDEPTSGLDYDSMVRVSHLIEQLAAAGVIIFVVSHDFEFITRTCSEVLQLDGQDSIKNQVLTPEILLSLSKQYFN